MCKRACNYYNYIILKTLFARTSTLVATCHVRKYLFLSLKFQKKQFLILYVKHQYTSTFSYLFSPTTIAVSYSHHQGTNQHMDGLLGVQHLPSEGSDGSKVGGIEATQQHLPSTSNVGLQLT